MNCKWMYYAILLTNLALLYAAPKKDFEVKNFKRYRGRHPFNKGNAAFVRGYSKPSKSTTDTYGASLYHLLLKTQDDLRRANRDIQKLCKKKYEEKEALKNEIYDLQLTKRALELRIHRLQVIVGRYSNDLVPYFLALADLRGAIESVETENVRHSEDDIVKISRNVFQVEQKYDIQINELTSDMLPVVCSGDMKKIIALPLIANIIENKMRLEGKNLTTDQSTLKPIIKKIDSNIVDPSIKQKVNKHKYTCKYVLVTAATKRARMLRQKLVDNNITQEEFCTCWGRSYAEASIHTHVPASIKGLEPSQKQKINAIKAVSRVHGRLHIVAEYLYQINDALRSETLPTTMSTTVEPCSDATDDYYQELQDVLDDSCDLHS